MAFRNSAYIDDEIEYIGQTSPSKRSEEFLCQFCSKNLSNNTAQQRYDHYEDHIRGEPQVVTVASGSSHGSILKNSILSREGKKPPSSSKDHDVFWYPSKSTPPPRNFSPGLIPVLKKALIRSHASGKGGTQRAWLCYERAVHVEVETWDRSWGCGYRNFLMACTALMDQQFQPMYFALLDHPTSPGVLNLQRWIEQAWADGYDREGAEEFNSRLVGTQRWIGTGELYVAFTAHSIPCQLVDFELKHGIEPLIDWIVSYFSSDSTRRTTVDDALRDASPVVVTNKMPIILQHKGHSRTVVGFERCAGDKINILIFDPSSGIRSTLRAEALANHSSTSSSRPSALPKPSFSPSKMVHQVLHPVKGVKAHKRKAPDSSGSQTKRARAAARRDGDNDVIVIDDSDDDGHEDGSDIVQEPSKGRQKLTGWQSVVKTFRVNEKSFTKHRKYQILYFPLNEPLDDKERWARRVVNSERFVS